MAPSTGAVYKDYFDNTTLSDLTLRIGDRLIHVHRIVLSSHSAYFNKFLTAGFKEADQKEIELHEDDPAAIDVVLRHMYDLPCNDALNDQVSLEYLSMIYVTADKYQVESLKEKVSDKIESHKNRQNLTDVEDFLNALEVVTTGTTPEDKNARTAMIDACVKHIDLLRQKPGFSALLREHGDIGAEIIYHNRLAPMIEGTWICDDKYEHADAVPTCFRCSRPFPESYVRSHRHLKTWVCPSCDKKDYPVCMVCGGGPKNCRNVKWQWRACTEEELLVR